MDTEKIKIESQKITFSNQNNEARKYDIRGTFQQRDGQIDAIEGGEVMQTGTSVATFSAWNGEQLNINFNISSGRTEIMTAIEEFIADVKAEA